MNQITEFFGGMVTISFFIAPVVFPNPIQFGKIYYIMIIILVILIEITKVSLIHFFPGVKIFRRPKGTIYKSLIPGVSWINIAGMPSGHEALTAFAFTLLYFTYPGMWSLLALITASIITFIARYIGLYHTPLQLVIGWIIGFSGAVIAHKYVFKKLKAN